MRPECPDCPVAYAEGRRRGMILGMVEAYGEIVRNATGLLKLHEREAMSDDETRDMLRSMIYEGFRDAPP